MESSFLNNAEAFRSHKLPRWKDLPELDLYMDQVIVLMQRYLGPYASGEDAITPSMINNYVKMNAIPAPVKKKYSRSHLARLLVICIMKRQLPIPVICQIINRFEASEDEERMFDAFVQFCEEAFTQIPMEDETDMAFYALKLAAKANAYRCFAGFAVDIISPKPEGETEKKEKEDKKKNG